MDIPDKKLIKLQNDLTKGHVMPIYFLCGEDTYLLGEAARFFKTMQNGFKDLNFSEFYAKETEPEKIIQSARTLPFMARYRLVVVKQAEKYGTSDWKSFNPYFKSPSSTTYLVFIIETVNLKKNYPGSLKNFGELIQFYSPKANDLRLWIKFFANKYKKNITSRAIEILRELLVNKLAIIDQELNKLSLFIGDKKNIDSDDILNITIPTRIESVFALINKISAKNEKESLFILKRLISKGEPPLIILSLIIRQYRLLTMIKGKSIEGLPPNKIKAELIELDLKIPDYFFNDLYQKSQKVSFEELFRAYNLIVNTDQELKKSRINKEILLENLVFHLCNYL
ncbi:MAG: DNA polymerase III subunit delta [Thermodesulfobacteriota bacterium]|nr:DNA polymerase III subunit delta [Thermodesulfobacteriota bacterium]